MSANAKLPRNNLGLYRLENFVGRQSELQQLTEWLQYQPVVAISGPSGAGKSTLATAWAVSAAEQFDEGIVWIGATGDTAFNFYDIVRDIEDVLATGISQRPIVSWPILMLQQLYGFNRLVIMDEITEADEPTIKAIVDLVKQIGPGGHGRFILAGRSIPQPILDVVGQAHLILQGLDETAIAEWIIRHQESYALKAEDSSLLWRLTGGHPLALKLVASLWHTADWAQLIELVSVQEPEEWNARLKATVTAALASLNRKYPAVSDFLIRCSQASGGISAYAMVELYWREEKHALSAIAAVQILLKRGLLMYNSQDNRYTIHPLIRRYLNVSGYPGLSTAAQTDFGQAYVLYYLRAAQQFARHSPSQWYKYDDDWGNIRKALNFLTEKLEAAIGIKVDHALATVNISALRHEPVDIDDIVILIKQYVLALRGYLLWRHPPEGRTWLAAGIISARYLLDRKTEALFSKTLAALVYFHLDYPSAQLWYRRCLPFFKEVNDQRRVIQTLKDLATVLRAMDNLDEALGLYQQALALAVEQNSISEQSTLLMAIGSVHYLNKDYQQAIMWHQQALELDQTHGNIIWQAIHCNNLGLAFESLGDYEQAIQFYERAIQLHIKCDNQTGLSATYGNLGAAYYSLGNLQQALFCYEQDMAIRDDLGNWLDLAAILHNMGHITLELDNISQAADYFTRSRDLYLEFGQTDLAEEEQILIDALNDRRVIRG